MSAYAANSGPAPYRLGGEENRYKDEIRRQPLELTQTEIPIATVSKTYSLVQHRDVISSVFRALRLMQRDISNLNATLLLSEYGKRMHWSCNCPDSISTPAMTVQLCFVQLAQFC